MPSEAQKRASAENRKYKYRRQPDVGTGNGSHALLTPEGRKRIPGLKIKAIKYAAEGMSPTKVAETLNIAYLTLCRWRKDDKDFGEQWSIAVEQGIDRMEDELYRRSVKGVDEPVYHCGEVVGYVKKYSDTMLMFGLRSRRPKVYRDRVEVDGSMRHQHAHLHLVAQASLPDLRGMDEGELARLYLATVTETEPSEGQPESPTD